MRVVHEGLARQFQARVGRVWLATGNRPSGTAAAQAPARTVGCEFLHPGDPPLRSASAAGQLHPGVWSGKTLREVRHPVADGRRVGMSTEPRELSRAAEVVGLEAGDLTDRSPPAQVLGVPLAPLADQPERPGRPRHVGDPVGWRRVAIGRSRSPESLQRRHAASDLLRQLAPSPQPRAFARSVTTHVGQAKRIHSPSRVAALPESPGPQLTAVRGYTRSRGQVARSSADAERRVPTLAGHDDGAPKPARRAGPVSARPCQLQHVGITEL